MSEVISFRLSEKNPREIQAKEVLKKQLKKGYSIRYTVIEALLLFEKEFGKADTLKAESFTENIERFAVLVERLEGHLLNTTIKPNHSDEELKDTFLEAIKVAVRPGLREE